MTDDEPDASGSRLQKVDRPVPPEPHRLVTDIHASFEQQIFDLPQ